MIRHAPTPVWGSHRVEAGFLCQFKGIHGRNALTSETGDGDVTSALRHGRCGNKDAGRTAASPSMNKRFVGVLIFAFVVASVASLCSTGCCSTGRTSAKAAAATVQIVLATRNIEVGTV